MRKPELVQAPAEEICFMEATALVELLRTKKVSPVEVMKAHLSQIARVNSKVNAIITLVEEETVCWLTRGRRTMRSPRETGLDLHMGCRLA